MTQTTNEQLSELISRWTQAETGQDIPVLDDLAVASFRLVGPAGFVLDKQQWLERYREGHLLTRTLTIEEPLTRLYNDVAVIIGRQVQDAEYLGRAASGEFRTTIIAVHEDERWRLAGLHLSPITIIPFREGRA